MKTTFQESSNQFSDSMTSQQAQMQELTDKLLENLGRQTTGLTDNLQKSTNDLHQDYSRFQEMSKEIQDGHLSGMKTNYEDSFKQMMESQELFKHNIEDMLSKNKSMFEPILNELKRNVNELSRQTLALPTELKKASTDLSIAFERIQNLLNNELNDFVRNQSQMNDSQRKSLAELSDYLVRVTHLQNESKSLQALMDKLVNLQEKIMSASDRKDDDFKDQLEVLRVAMEQQRSLLATHQDASAKLQEEYKDINQLVGTVAQNFGGIGQSLADSINQMKSASHHYFDGFSEYHTQAISQLKSLVDDMGSAISDAQFTVTK